MLRWYVLTVHRLFFYNLVKFWTSTCICEHVKHGPIVSGLDGRLDNPYWHEPMAYVEFRTHHFMQWPYTSGNDCLDMGVYNIFIWRTYDRFWAMHFIFVYKTVLILEQCIGIHYCYLTVRCWWIIHEYYQPLSLYIYIVYYDHICHLWSEKRIHTN